MNNRTMTALHKAILPRSFDMQARAKIRNLDIEPIKYKLVKEAGWDLARADRVGVLYKGFLLLHLLRPLETHVPTQEIDEMWHAHILDTAKYMRDCHQLFGSYLHHFPYLGLRGAEDAVFADQSFVKTRQNFIEICGIDPLAGDAMSASDCGGGGCSSSSCSSSSCSSGNDGGGKSTPSSDTPSSTPDKSPGSGGGKGKSSCGATHVPFNDPARGNTDSTRRTPAAPPPPRRQPEPEKPLWRRILGLSGRTDLMVPDEWARSVDPCSELALAKRPGRDELLMLAETTPPDVTRH